MLVALDVLLFNTDLQREIDLKIAQDLNGHRDEFFKMVQRMEEKIDNLDQLIRTDVSQPPPPYVEAKSGAQSSRNPSTDKPAASTNTWTESIGSAVGMVVGATVTFGLVSFAISAVTGA